MVAKLNNFFGLQNLVKNRRTDYRDLIRNEAKMGGQIFGEVPKNRRREFFCLDEHTWVWHEEWYDQFGKLQSKTTRYEIQRDRILKFQDGQYFKMDKAELKNFYLATKQYYEKISTELYASAV